MKYITAFFMAWGNFIILPCPHKKWDVQLKNYMLAFLPGVGGVIGTLWMLVFYLTTRGFYEAVDVLRRFIELPVGLYISPLVAGFFMTAYIYMISGFFHLDGYMDCCDAILSRRPLEERQKILKDSRVGAFSVVSVILLILGMWACMTTFIDNQLMIYGRLFIIPVLSRMMSAHAVMTYAPIGHSQYTETFDRDEKNHCKVLTFIITGALVIIGSLITLYLGSIEDLIPFVAQVVVMIVASHLSLLYARKNLGGMSGDVSGYSISVSEVIGVLTLAVI